ncbi:MULTISPECIES: hypothetical protein [Aeromonas]|nr:MULTISPECIES: hypothetical protein [Aeromonas]MDE8808942.1 hypothetical protein [Aeromonas hydrophila]MDK3166245.1 hypothetical protein [Aeromonas caviae]MDX7649028.1 hypothetical protein [Aeromonas caviae]
MEQRIAAAQPKLKAWFAWNEPPQIRFVLTTQTLTKNGHWPFLLCECFYSTIIRDCSIIL